MAEVKKFPIDKVIQPIQRFMSQAQTGGIVLGINVILALILANSPWADQYFEILKYRSLAPPI